VHGLHPADVTRMGSYYNPEVGTLKENRENMPGKIRTTKLQKLFSLIPTPINIQTDRKSNT
jgi:hypothetical protein